MAYELKPDPADAGSPEQAAIAGNASFRLSPDPVVENGNSGAAADDTDAPAFAAASSGLYLMARDPHSLFAYWEIDWTEAFREQMPRDRKVHLRISGTDGAEETTLEVEPMGGSCYIDVTDGGESYTAEIGYYEPAGVWNSVAASMSAATPPDSIDADEPPDFATVPFHLSFQRMIDLFRVSKHENESLTAMLGDLRERAASPTTSAPLTPEEREIVHAIDEAVAQSAPAISSAGESPDLWVQQNLQRILGFGARTTSPDGGFGASGAS